MRPGRDEVEVIARRAIFEAWSDCDLHVRAAVECALLDARKVTVDALWRDAALQRLIREVVRDVRLAHLERKASAMAARSARLLEQLASARRTILEVAESLDAGSLKVVLARRAAA
jgi:hypothetical protein